MIGTAYFHDGHTEDIIDANVSSDNFGEKIEFFTESGRYFYRSWYEYPETLYCDNNPVMKGNLRHKFYKLEFNVEFSVGEPHDGDPRYEPRIVDVPIKKIELKEQKNHA